MDYLNNPDYKRCRAIAVGSHAPADDYVDQKTGRFNATDWIQDRRLSNDICESVGFMTCQFLSIGIFEIDETTYVVTLQDDGHIIRVEEYAM